MTDVNPSVKPIKSDFVDGLQRRLEGELRIPSTLIQEIYETKVVRDGNGKSYPLDINISRAHANALYQTILKTKPSLVLEVGMAFGLSSLAICSALDELGADGKLISLDPFQERDYHNVGVAHIERAGLAGRHVLIEGFDYVELPKLVEQGTRLQFAYIDGWHTFDYTLVDFFFIDKMLDAGGVVAFNDCGLPGVRRATRFVRSHRMYEKMDVGLKRNFLTRKPLTMARYLLTLQGKEDRYYRKLQDWEPTWDFYAYF